MDERQQNNWSFYFWCTCDVIYLGIGPSYCHIFWISVMASQTYRVCIRNDSFYLYVYVVIFRGYDLKDCNYLDFGGPNDMYPTVLVKYFKI